jgi:hypothetical protein
LSADLADSLVSTLGQPWPRTIDSLEPLPPSAYFEGAFVDPVKPAAHGLLAASGEFHQVAERLLPFVPNPGAGQDSASVGRQQARLGAGEFMGIAMIMEPEYSNAQEEADQAEQACEQAMEHIEDLFTALRHLPALPDGQGQVAISPEMRATLEHLMALAGPEHTDGEARQAELVAASLVQSERLRPAQVLQLLLAAHDRMAVKLVASHMARLNARLARGRVWIAGLAAAYLQDAAEKVLKDHLDTDEVGDGPPTGEDGESVTELYSDPLEPIRTCLREIVDTPLSSTWPLPTRSSGGAASRTSHDD